MATYNWAPVLPYSIGSALRQTMDDFELLVIGDGCTDESEEVVRAIDDPRVQWVNLPVNGGSQAGPNNEGLRRARAAHTAYLGHDDLWLPDHLHQLLWAARGGATITHGLQLQIRPQVRPCIRPRPEWTYTPGAWIPPTSLMHRTEPARAVGGWRFPAETGRLDSDGDLWARIAGRFGPPKRVQHVTSIKFPAAVRRDVYRLRPCHEQKRWTERVLQADDPEQTARMATNDPIDQSLGMIPEEFFGNLPAAAAEVHAVRRRIKGLDFPDHSHSAGETVPPRS